MAESNDIAALLRHAWPDLRAQWPIRSLALFGSRVRDDATANSELDVLVAFAEPMPLSAILVCIETVLT